VQDYNLPVLSLVTLPNLVLAALTSLPESARTAEAAPEDADREQDEAEAEDEFDDDADSEDAPPLPFDPTRAGNLDVSPALLDAFISILDDRGIDLRFTYGDWSGMAQQLAAEHEAAAEQQPYGLILTAETIYAEESVQGLLDVLRTASRQDKDESKVDKGMERETQKENLEDSLGALNVRDDWAKALGEGEPVILVAAKVSFASI
jgi:protein-histidine N-methyltransferase